MSRRPKSRVFLLSPAHCGGKRAGYIFSPTTTVKLAKRLQRGQSVPIGDIFSFISGLYFRGKLSYAKHFAEPGYVFVITPNRGLLTPTTKIDLEAFRMLSNVDIHEDDRAYLDPLENDLEKLCRKLGSTSEVVLLGSIATDKYMRCLLACFGERLLFPKDFIGRGDLSRGGLLLRATEADRELEYIPALGALRKGPRPPKLPRK